MIEDEKNLKMYQEVLLKINKIIFEDKLSEGDRLPSERELAYRLNVGRSSVREALRILELLGLISTRRGDGTFIDDHTSHRLVEIVASYILKNNKSKKDLLEFQKLIELDIIKLAAERMDENYLNQIDTILKLSEYKIKLGENPAEEDYLFHKTIALASGNNLLYKTWLKLVEYGNTVIETLETSMDFETSIIEHRGILKALKEKNVKEAEYLMRLHIDRYKIRD